MVGVPATRDVAIPLPFDVDGEGEEDDGGGLSSFAVATAGLDKEDGLRLVWKLAKASDNSADAAFSLLTLRISASTVVA